MDTPNQPTIEELRRIYEEGIEQTLISGVTVRMHPVQLDKLLEAGDIPDVLSSLILRALYEDVREEIDSFVMTPQTDKAKAVDVIRSVDAVCRSVLIHPSIVAYLSLTDRLWLFKLAFMPAEVLSRFRHQPAGDVDAVDEGENISQAAQ